MSSEWREWEGVGGRGREWEGVGGAQEAGCRRGERGGEAWVGGWQGGEGRTTTMEGG